MTYAQPTVIVPKRRWAARESFNCSERVSLGWNSRLHVFYSADMRRRWLVSMRRAEDLGVAFPLSDEVLAVVDGQRTRRPACLAVSPASMEDMGWSEKSDLWNQAFFALWKSVRDLGFDHHQAVTPGNVGMRQSFGVIRFGIISLEPEWTR